MFSFLFNKKINTKLLRLAQTAYGGEFYYGLNEYCLKEINFLSDKFQKVNDTLLAKIGNNKFYSYKNLDSGFVATLFENKKNGNLVIAYRGTERLGLGENFDDIVALTKDMITDSKFITGEIDEQFNDAYNFYKIVKSENQNKKIIIVGHSLGGGLAQLVSAKAYSELKEKVETYSYNAPGCKHLLKVFCCDENLDYSFITNYAVMNDWCGMFGENIGQTYIIPSIPMSEVDINNTTEVLKNILLKSHEGIFEYSGKVYKKPKNFNQQEGLSLWYFDKNNPIKDISISDYIYSLLPMANPKILENMNQSVSDAANSLPEPLKKLADEINIGIQESINNNTITLMTRFLESTLSELNETSYNNAINLLKKIK